MDANTRDTHTRPIRAFAYNVIILFSWKFRKKINALCNSIFLKYSNKYKTAIFEKRSFFKEKSTEAVFSRLVFITLTYKMVDVIFVKVNVMFIKGFKIILIHFRYVFA